MRHRTTQQSIVQHVAADRRAAVAGDSCGGAACLDHHLAEYATRIPPDVRIRDGVEKWVLREAMNRSPWYSAGKVLPV